MAELLDYLQRAVTDGASDLFLIAADASVKRLRAGSVPSVRRKSCRRRQNG